MKKYLVLLAVFFFSCSVIGQNDIALNSLGIESIFKGFDAKKIKAVIDNNEAQNVTSVNRDNATLIAKYVKAKYGYDCNEDGDDSPDATLIFGLFCYGKEKGLGEISDSAMSNRSLHAGEDPFNCLVGAIGGIIGLSEVRSLYNDYTHGVSGRTIMRTLRVMVRRVGSVFTVISAVYSFGDCLDWW